MGPGPVRGLPAPRLPVVSPLLPGCGWLDRPEDLLKAPLLLLRVALNVAPSGQARGPLSRKASSSRWWTLMAASGFVL